MIDRCAALAMPKNAEAAAGVAGAEPEVPASGPPLARPPRPEREHRQRRRARAGRGWTVKTLDERRLCRADPPPPCRRLCGLGAGRSRRESTGDTRSSANRGARSHRPDLRNAILALASARRPYPTIPACSMSRRRSAHRAIGIFGPTSPWHWAPLNPLAATVETATELACRPCHKPVCRLGHHHCMDEIGTDQVLWRPRALAAVADHRGKLDIPAA